MALAEELRRIARGEVLDDDWNRLVYSVDASHYQVEPELVAFPRDSDDLQAILGECFSNRVPVIGRGAGTGLLGQSLGHAVILDFTKHMNRIVEITGSEVKVQPGMVKAQLDLELAEIGKFLPPDPASSNYCTVGGMIANNSSGIHCLGYGNTIDFLSSVRLRYADGSEGLASSSEYDGRFEALKGLALPYMGHVRQTFPQVAKNSCGYRVDRLLRGRSYEPHKIIASSEGTLGLVTEATFRILDLPEQRCLVTLGFEDLLEALEAVPSILRFGPVALEMVDGSVFSGSPGTAGAGCVLFVEFAGKRQVAQRRLESCIGRMRKQATILEQASDRSSLTKIWAARKGALNNIMKLTVGSRKPVGLIEDTVVRPELLASFVAYLLRQYKSLGLSYVMYGHVGDGNMHTRPVIDLDSEAQLRAMDELALKVFRRVVASRGTITGEHGDGIARLPYVEMVYGRRTMGLFRKIKELFDPAFLLNPGKKVPLTSLR